MEVLHRQLTLEMGLAAEAGAWVTTAMTDATTANGSEPTGLS